MLSGRAGQLVERAEAPKRSTLRSAPSARVATASPTSAAADAVEPLPYARWFKPVLDRVGALLLLVLLLPLLAVITLVVWAQLGRPVIYRQRRVGRSDAEFDVLKFRTMQPDRRQSHHPVLHGADRRTSHKREDDPRHTRVGRFLRRCRLDELPQLWNVLRGEMSLVGPRPELVDVAEEHGLRHHPRNAVRPGMTGAWQVSRNASAHLHDGVEVDLDYIQRITFLLDAKILLQTIATVMRRTGA